MQKHPNRHPDKVKLMILMKDELDRLEKTFKTNGSVSGRLTTFPLTS